MRGRQACSSISCGCAGPSQLCKAHMTSGAAQRMEVVWKCDGLLRQGQLPCAVRPFPLPRPPSLVNLLATGGSTSSLQQSYTPPPCSCCAGMARQPSTPAGRLSCGWGLQQLAPLQAGRLLYSNMRCSSPHAGWQPFVWPLLLLSMKLGVDSSFMLGRCSPLCNELGGRQPLPHTCSHISFCCCSCFCCCRIQVVARRCCCCCCYRLLLREQLIAQVVHELLHTHCCWVLGRVNHEQHLHDTPGAHMKCQVR